MHGLPDVLLPQCPGACTASGPHLPGTQPLGVYRTVSFTGPLWRSLGPDMREALKELVSRKNHSSI